MENYSKNILTSLWQEKIKLTQYTINQTCILNQLQLDYTSEGEKWSIFKHIQHIVWIDRMMKWTVPFSLFMSLILPFRPLTEKDFNNELDKVAHFYQTPAIPPGLNKIYLSSANLIDTTQVENPGLKKLYEKWKSALIFAEGYIKKLPQTDYQKKRFFTAIGVYSFPTGIELHVQHTSHYLHKNILPAMKETRVSEINN